MKQTQTMNVTASQFAKAVLNLRGKPLSLDDYLPFQSVYDTDPPLMVIKAGRQIGKSVSLGGAIISKSIIRSFFNSLYIAPLSQQTSRFSTGYLDPFMQSPLVRKHYVDASSRKNVFEKSFSNGSTIYLGYAESENDADRIRGVFADSIFCDEIQDISMEALPILFETLAASEYAFKRLTGTAKTENNTLEIWFKKSNMLEWVVKCDHCGKYTVPHDFETCIRIMEREDGPACVHCGGGIDMRKGTWIALKPSVKDIVGYHMPQFIIPARTVPKKWKELKSKIRDYTPQKLSNEVFGLASGVGGRILSLSEVRACCNIEKREFDSCWPMDTRGITQVVVGVDWSVTGSEKSFTVITVLGSDFNGKIHLLHAERINGVDILVQVRRVEHIYRQFNAQLVASDRGVGVLQCQLLQQSLGYDRVIPINYVAAKTHLRWDRQGHFLAADRTMTLDAIILKLKMGRNHFESPCWELMDTFYQDALNVFEEETLSGRRVYRKDQDVTDDFLHSINFANVGMMYLRGEFRYVEDIDSEGA